MSDSQTILFYLKKDFVSSCNISFQSMEKFCQRANKHVKNVVFIDTNFILNFKNEIQNNKDIHIYLSNYDK